VYLKSGKMADYSADHITTPEAHELIRALNEKLGKKGDNRIFPRRFVPPHNWVLRQEHSDAITTTPLTTSRKILSNATFLLRKTISGEATAKLPQQANRGLAAKSSATTCEHQRAKGEPLPCKFRLVLGSGEKAVFSYPQIPFQQDRPRSSLP